MKFVDATGKLMTEENLLVEELILEAPVTAWIDRAGQLAGVRNAQEAGFDKMGRAVIQIGNNGAVNVATGSMQMDHNKIGSGLRFFWGIKNGAFLFTGKNEDDMDSLFRKDKMLFGQGITKKQGQVVASALGTLMKQVGAQPTPQFNASLRKKLSDAGVLAA